VNLCDFFIGSRMHSCIAALSQNIPCIGIAYSKKFIGVFSSISLNESVIDARNMSEKEIINKCFELFKNQQEISNSLKEIIPIIKEKLYNCFNGEIFI
jgi:colanic acid/amylovoran biosynthesis protein